MVMSETVGVRYACPCCGYLTLSTRANAEVCPVCWWKDDGRGGIDVDLVRDGLNRNLSLAQARANFARIGAVHRHDLRRVRAPRDDEQPLSR
jgi:hypothetical protein